MTIAAIIGVLVAALLGAPLFLVIAAFALLIFTGTATDPLGSLLEQVGDVVSQDIFLAIPLFTFAGFLMAAANTPTRLVNISKAALGWMPGGLAIVALATCAFFTAFTGASGVTIIALGGLLFPILLKEQYPDRFSLGLLTTGGSRGLIFPPSLPLILYATIAAMVYTPIVQERERLGPPADARAAYEQAEAAFIAALPIAAPKVVPGGAAAPAGQAVVPADQAAPAATQPGAGDGEVDLEALEKQMLDEPQAPAGGGAAPAPPADAADGAPGAAAAPPAAKATPEAAAGDEEVDLDALEAKLGGDEKPPTQPVAPAAAQSPRAAAPAGGLAEEAAGGDEEVDLDALEAKLGGEEAPKGAAPAGEPATPAAKPAAAQGDNDGDVDLDALEQEMTGEPAPAAPVGQPEPGTPAPAEPPPAAVTADEAAAPPPAASAAAAERAKKKALRAGRKALAGQASAALDAFTLGFVDDEALQGRARRFEPTGNLVQDWWAARMTVEADRKPTPEKLFLAGAIPGGLFVLAIGVYAILLGARRKVPRSRFSLGELGRSLLAVGWELPIPFIIVIGIFGGFFTAQEAAGVTAFYVLIVEVLLYRDVSLKKLGKVIVDSMVLVGAVMVILIAALALKQGLVNIGAPETIRDAMTSWVTSRVGFLLVLNVFLLIVGCLMDIYSAVLVVVPLIVPIAAEYGVHPLHLGVIFLTNLEIGYSTPPVGINLFIASLRFRRPVLQLYHATVPFLAIMVVGLALVTYLPDLSLWLVRALGLEG